MKAIVPFLLLLAGCRYLSGDGLSADLPGGRDLQPPRILQVSMTGPDCLCAEFDESVLKAGETLITPELPITTVEAAGCSLEVQFAFEPVPGKEYQIQSQVRDERGNRTFFAARFYGYNAALPAMLFNEINLRGSGKHPDLIEFFVQSGGNTAGITVYAGTFEEYAWRYVFPSLEVAANDYIVLHCKSVDADMEYDENDSKSLSGGYDACDTAWDLWTPEPCPLSGNNGGLLLCTRPEGDVLDAFLYSNRTVDADTDYDGFGSRKLQAFAAFLAEEYLWCFENARPRPEDAVNPDGSTGTRTLCRMPDSADTDSREDWHIVPTRGATPGKANSAGIYIP